MTSIPAIVFSAVLKDLNPNNHGLELFTTTKKLICFELMKIAIHVSKINYIGLCSYRQKIRQYWRRSGGFD
jgi:hypothetical protein